MSPPTVSVVVTAFNEPKYLHESLISVLAQSSQDYELILVDDGSDEDLSEAIEECHALGERFIHLRQATAGDAIARNRGIAAARGRWIAFLDHDDCWLPDKLSRQLAAVTSNDEVGMVFCQFRKFGDRDGGKSYPEQSPSGWLLPEFLRRNVIGTLSTVLIRRSVIPGDEWFRQDLANASEVDLYYRVAEKAQIKFVPRILVEKRVHGRSNPADLLETHREGALVANELADRLGEGAGREVHELLDARICRHLLGLAEAARRSGDRRLSRDCYRQVMKIQPLRARATLGWLGSWV
ncbi:MAG: glycosyltransferase family 2 protein [Planctomycetota bacterium]|jgi:glycosyltransferase involved in cell wall biosynthesis